MMKSPNADNDVTSTKAHSPDFLYYVLSGAHGADLGSVEWQTGSLDDIATPLPGDIVVDLRGSRSILSREIGAMVRLVNRLAGTDRFLRVVSGREIRTVLHSTNLTKLRNLKVYESLEALAVSTL